MNEKLTKRSLRNLLTRQGSLDWDESFDYKAERSRTVMTETLKTQAVKSSHHERDGAPE